MTAAIYFTLKKPLEAEPYLREALEVFDPKERALSGSVIMNSYMIANVYVNSHRAAEGARVLDQVLPAAERAFGEESVQAGVIRLLRGRCHAEAGENDKADEMLTRGYAIIEKRWGKKRYDTEQANGLLRSFYGKIGNDQKQEAAIRRAIELRENVENNPEHDSVLNVKAEYAEFLLKRGRKDEARAVIEPILPIAQRALAADHPARKRIEAAAAECGTAK